MMPHRTDHHEVITKIQGEPDSPPKSPSFTGTAMFHAEVRTARAASADATQFSRSPTEADGTTGTASSFVDVRGLPH